MKASRHEKILEIIAREEVETQNGLLELLCAEGIKATQATLSRDIKELRLVKELTQEGGYRYAVGRDEFGDNEKRLRKIFRESVTSVEQAQNLIVIKTLPGLAPAACSTLDGMHIPNLVGTIAGDDTAFIAMRDDSSAESFCRSYTDGDFEL